MIQTIAPKDSRISARTTIGYLLELAALPVSNLWRRF
jgi:hypothetical protein